MLSRRQALGLALGSAGGMLLNSPRSWADPMWTSPADWSVPRRGLSLDVGRKYFTTDWLRRLIDYIANLGMNELHLHFSENEAVRIVSQRFPELNTGRQYTWAEITGLIHYATEREVAVIPEFDMPGHMGAVLRAHPEFRLRNRFGVANDAALDITSEDALRFAEDLLDDYSELFDTSTHWNLGFDEFLGVGSIEQLYTNLDARARELYGPNATQHDLTTAVANRLAGHLRAHGYTVSVWNDAMGRGEIVKLAPEVIVHYWTYQSSAQAPVTRFLDAGHTVMNFNDRQLYYVLGNPGYPTPTATSVLERGWTPGEFPPISAGPVLGAFSVGPSTPQTLDAPYPAQLGGAVFSIWCDQPRLRTEDEVFNGIAEPLAAFVLRCRDPRAEVTAIDAADLARRARSPLLE